MQLNRDAKGPLGDLKTHAVFAYDLIAKKYTGNLFDNSGAIESATISIGRNVWHWAGNGYARDGRHDGIGERERHRPPGDSHS